MTRMFDVWASSKTEATRIVKFKHPTYKITYLNYTGESKLVKGKIVGDWEVHIDPK